ncbi:hypothetical protein [Thalassobacillus sp. B23F22_16]
MKRKTSKGKKVYQNRFFKATVEPIVMDASSVKKRPVSRGGCCGKKRKI